MATLKIKIKTEEIHGDAGGNGGGFNREKNGFT